MVYLAWCYFDGDSYYYAYTNEMSMTEFAGKLSTELRRDSPSMELWVSAEIKIYLSFAQYTFETKKPSADDGFYNANFIL